MATIKVLPNQSMPDVIIMATGSMEAGWQFCSDNGVSITDYPAVGTVYQVSAAALALGDQVVLQYLACDPDTLKPILIGTLNLLPEVFKVIMTEDGSVPLTDESGDVLAED